jgi:hypothetical protein
MKTLFASMPGRAGVLVTESKWKRRKRAMRFKDSCAALRWCEKNGATLVYFPTANAAAWMN